MREFKFRSWNIDHSVMIYDDQWGADWPALRKAQEMKIISIMQYTGLKDKNGKEIYEGDILKGNTVVEFSETDASVQGSVCDVPILCFNHGYPLALDEEYEVIGNIYENPELIK